MARGSASFTPTSTWSSLPSNTVGSGGNVVVEFLSASTKNPLEVRLSSDGAAHKVVIGGRIYFNGLTNTNQVAVYCGGSSMSACFSWGA